MHGNAHDRSDRPEHCTLHERGLLPETSQVLTQAPNSLLQVGGGDGRYRDLAQAGLQGVLGAENKVGDSRRAIRSGNGN
eukprot:1723623-Rhodomonas_salina.3